MRGGSNAPAPLQLFRNPDQVQRHLPEPVFHTWAFPDGKLWLQFHRRGSAYLLRFPGLADFEISADGQSVQAWSCPGTGDSTIEHLYLNQVRPLALSRQGKLVLHASAVEVGGFAMAFVGESGRGKSTLAASFTSTGASLLADDGLELVLDRARVVAVPGHPSIRLWDDSRSALIGATEAMAAPLDYTTKARILAGADFQHSTQACELRALCFLGAGDAQDFEMSHAKPADALLALVRNSFLLDIDERQMLALHFDEISRIANLPIHYHLDYPRRFDDLASVRARIVDHTGARSE